MKGKEKYPVSIYEYRCRRCKEIFTMTIEDNFGDLVGMMLNLNKSDKEIEEELAIFISPWMSCTVLHNIACNEWVDYPIPLVFRGSVTGSQC